MAIYEIVERSMDRGGLYVRVKFWRDAAERLSAVRPHVESFQWFGLQKQQKEIVENVDGWPQLLDGTFVDPKTLDLDNLPKFKYRIVDVDLVGMVRAKLATYAKWLDYDAPRTDRSETRYARSTKAQDDPEGLLTATDNMADEVREVL